MIQDHRIEVMKGEDGKYLACIFCGTCKKLRGDTQKQRDTHMLIALNEFSHDCNNSYEISGITNDGELMITNTSAIERIDAKITVSK